MTRKKRSDMPKLYQRPLPEARHALRKLLADLRSPELLGEVFQEDFIAASWMWMQTMDPAEVAAGVKPYLSRFLESFGDEDGPSSARMDPSEPDLGPVGNRIAVPHEPPKKTPKRRSG
jgi:hypothetical protein